MSVFCLWLTLFCAAPSAAANLGQESILYDDLHNPFHLSAPPQRIVSLAPNITETLFALNLGPRVVGVTRFCDYPPEATSKEKVGGLVDPSLEKIQVLHPDLVIAFRGNPIGVVNKLKSLNLPVFVFDARTSLESLLEMIRKMGRLTFEVEAAENLCRDLLARRRRVELALEGTAGRPRVFLALHGQGLWTCGSESYLNDLIVQAKGINIAGGIPRRWLNLTREELVHDNPDVIIVLAGDSESFRSSKDRLLADSRLKTIAAVRTGNVRFLDENTASRFGPRLFQALGDVARILHPDRFPAGQ